MKKIRRCIAMMLVFIMTGLLWMSDSVHAQSEIQVVSDNASEEMNQVNFDGGTGTKEDPYLISTVDQLKLVHNNLTSSFKLCCDLDLSEEENWVPLGGSYIPIEINSEDEFIRAQEKYGDLYYFVAESGGYPTASEYLDETHSYFYFTEFKGSFDGNNYTISNVKMVGYNALYFGFFGLVNGSQS